MQKEHSQLAEQAFSSQANLIIFQHLQQLKLELEEKYINFDKFYNLLVKIVENLSMLESKKIKINLQIQMLMTDIIQLTGKTLKDIYHHHFSSSKQQEEIKQIKASMDQVIGIGNAFLKLITFITTDPLYLNLARQQMFNYYALWPYPQIRFECRNFLPDLISFWQLQYKKQPVLFHLTLENLVGIILSSLPLGEVSQEFKKVFGKNELDLALQLEEKNESSYHRHPLETLLKAAESPVFNSHEYLEIYRKHHESKQTISPFTLECFGIYNNLFYLKMILNKIDSLPIKYCVLSLTVTGKFFQLFKIKENFEKTHHFTKPELLGISQIKVLLYLLDKEIFQKFDASQDKIISLMVNILLLFIDFLICLDKPNNNVPENSALEIKIINTLFSLIENSNQLIMTTSKRLTFNYLFFGYLLLVKQLISQMKGPIPSKELYRLISVYSNFSYNEELIKQCLKTPNKEIKKLINQFTEISFSIDLMLLVLTITLKNTDPKISFDRFTTRLVGIFQNIDSHAAHFPSSTIYIKLKSRFQYWLEQTIMVKEKSDSLAELATLAIKQIKQSHKLSQKPIIEKKKEHKQDNRIEHTLENTGKGDDEKRIKKKQKKLQKKQRQQEKKAAKKPKSSTSLNNHKDQSVNIVPPAQKKNNSKLLQPGTKETHFNPTSKKASKKAKKNNFLTTNGISDSINPSPIPEISLPTSPEPLIPESNELSVFSPKSEESATNNLPESIAPPTISSSPQDLKKTTISEINLISDSQVQASEEESPSIIIAISASEAKDLQNNLNLSDEKKQDENQNEPASQKDCFQAQFSTALNPFSVNLTESLKHPGDTENIRKSNNESKSQTNRDSLTRKNSRFFQTSEVQNNKLNKPQTHILDQPSSFEPSSEVSSIVQDSTIGQQIMPKQPEEKNNDQIKELNIQIDLLKNQVHELKTQVEKKGDQLQQQNIERQKDKEEQEQKINNLSLHVESLQQKLYLLEQQTSSDDSGDNFVDQDLEDKHSPDMGQDNEDFNEEQIFETYSDNYLPNQDHFVPVYSSTHELTPSSISVPQNLITHPMPMPSPHYYAPNTLSFHHQPQESPSSYFPMEYKFVGEPASYSTVSYPHYQQPIVHTYDQSSPSPLTPASYIPYSSEIPSYFADTRGPQTILILEPSTPIALPSSEAYLSPPMATPQISSFIRQTFIRPSLPPRSATQTFHGQAFSRDMQSYPR